MEPNEIDTIDSNVKPQKLTTRQALKAIDEANKKLGEAQAALEKIRRQRKILCSCGKKHAIGKLKLLITHWYVAPSGCTDGDYWNEGEFQFQCPTTGVRNRFLFDDYRLDYGKRDTVGIAAGPTFKSMYRNLFAEQEKVYERNKSLELKEIDQFFNNFYVDLHRKKFELPLKPEKK